MRTLSIVKTREVNTPSYGTPGSAGIDFYLPTLTEEFVRELKAINGKDLVHYSTPYEDNVASLYIYPHCKLLIPSGIHVNIPNSDMALIAFNKSGISSKKGLSILASVVDSDYQGEIHLSITNTTQKRQRIFSDAKLIQFILLPIYTPEIKVEESLTTLYTERSTRGEGGFGSTGN